MYGGQVPDSSCVRDCYSSRNPRSGGRASRASNPERGPTARLIHSPVSKPKAGTSVDGDGSTVLNRATKHD